MMKLNNADHIQKEFNEVSTKDLDKLDPKP
jgi:hypothetical protein